MSSNAYTLHTESPFPMNLDWFVVITNPAIEDGSLV